MEVRRREEEERTQEKTQKLGLPYINLFGMPVDPAALLLVPEEDAQKLNLIPIRKQGKNLDVALVDPTNQASKKIIEDLEKQGFFVSVFLISPSSAKDGLSHYKEIAFTKEKEEGQIEISSALIAKTQQEIKGIDSLKAQIKEIPPAKTSDLLETIIAGALKLECSDVHLEPKEENAILKYRLDGLLYEITNLPLAAYNLILSRVKLLSKMKLNIKDAAQDGRLTIKLVENEIEIRSSSIPGSYGESIVLRLLDPKTIGLDLKDLGFRPEDLEALEKEIKRPNGLIITTGPTGSGKTTTLYAFIKKIMRPEVKVITLEDPIEYHLSGITQTQIDEEASYTFAKGLRAILRQDPDILLIGEIRDSETAKTALDASLTGHFVFSTLHTNDAAGAVPRLLDLGANKGSLAASLNLIMAQRLIRRLCSCKEKYNPPKEAIKEISDTLKNIKHPPIEKAPFFKPKGCDKCNGLGYKGRVGVLELILVDDEMEKLIAQNPSHSDVSEFAKKKGMITMRQDALLKAMEGITSLEEIERVID